MTKLGLWVIVLAQQSYAQVALPNFDDFEGFQNYANYDNDLTESFFDEQLSSVSSAVGNDDRAVIRGNDRWCIEKTTFNGAYIKDGKCRIPVCWKTPNYTAEKKIVENAIDSSWGAQSGVSFRWDTQCGQKFRGIVIRVIDEKVIFKGKEYPPNPWTIGNGRAMGSDESLKKYGYSMQLNFTFKNWGKSLPGSNKNKIRVIAIHEFGHALGFNHEHLRLTQNRSKEVMCTRKGLLGLRDEFVQKVKHGELTPDKAVHLFTAYDPNSIMNYCNRIFRGEKGLSKLDKIALEFSYPIRTN